MNKKDIKNLSIDGLQEEFSDISVPLYRAKQIFYWLYKRGVAGFDNMANIPVELRNKLKAVFFIGGLSLKECLKSEDKTEKFLFELSDGNFIESVLIYSRDRRTLCISTQAGCKYGCSFCASGSKGFIRNLTVSEILNQILYVKYRAGHQITNFVFMGMGEPLDNLDNVLTAISIMNSPDGMEIGARRITVSTCGIIPGIEKIRSSGILLNLSLSLHACDDILRTELMPVNNKYPLAKLIPVCEDFIKRGGRQITLEYILINGKNNSLKDAEKLADIAKRLKAKINLIPYSPVPDKDFSIPSKEDIREFKDILLSKNIKVSVRESKGKDIDAACGQLAMKMKSKNI